MSANNTAKERFEEGMSDSEVNIETFANENNVWRSQQLRLETMSGDDLAMERYPLFSYYSNNWVFSDSKNRIGIR